MTLMNCFQQKTLPSLGLLAFRGVMGSAFILHGMGKIQSPFTWMGDAPVPGLMQALAAFSEFGGGIALVLGFLTPITALLLIGTMVGALGLVHLPQGHPFVSATGGHSSELAVVYLAGAILFLLNSPGKFSVDYFLFKKFQGKQPQTPPLSLQV